MNAEADPFSSGAVRLAYTHPGPSSDMESNSTRGNKETRLPAALIKPLSIATLQPPSTDYFRKNYKSSHRSTEKCSLSPIETAIPDC
ncbi:hypothetical protein PoB_007675600 [Plakobranchus ocellatus]|uniref:Uncharacterized protein n=1 Tax=Plakobranchus ocellatus TaxID=259542 RepID=A0AAV4E2E0_9GAST|nr:hypothetical protein PoB_007675600 [Plakobranchus ocellatus]